MTKFIPTICPYCGTGCGILLVSKNGEVIGTRPWTEQTISGGSLCIKGWHAHEFIHHKERLTKPLIKDGDSFREIEWEEALNTVADKLSEIREKNGPDALGFLTSAKCSNEETYLLQKLARAVIGTNNVDHCARLCHASTVAGLAAAFGSGAMTNSIPDIAQSKCIFIIGSDTMSQHPLIGAMVMKARTNGANLVVADPRRIQVSLFADLHIRQKPGSDVALLNGMMKYILQHGLEDKTFIIERTEDFDKLKNVLDGLTFDEIEKITGVPLEEIEKAALLYARSEAGCIIYSMGITQHTCGTDNVLSIANLAMLTGNIGRPGTGVNPLRGQNNVQGACDMGGLPNVFTGYQAVTDDKLRSKMAEAWGVEELPTNTGLTLTEMLPAASEGKIKAMFIMGENPMVSDPDINHVEQALKNLDFLVVQDIFPTETAKLANIILPAGSWAEKDGTVTNTDRRVQLIRKATEPVGNSKADWQIICELAGKLASGDKFSFLSPEDIFQEIRKVTPSYAGMSYTRLNQPEGLQWPCPTEDHPGTPILHKEKFTRGKGKFHPVIYRDPAENPSEEFPLILTTGRLIAHWHTRSMTGRSPTLEAEAPEGFIEINPADAAGLGIKAEDMVEVSSRRDTVRTRAMVTDRVPQGVVYMPFHYAEAPANKLTNPALDPVAKIPEFKVCAVAVKGL